MAPWPYCRTPVNDTRLRNTASLGSRRAGKDDSCRPRRGSVGQRQHLSPRLGLFATDAAPIPSFAHWIGGGTAAAVGVWSGSFLLAAAVIVVSVYISGAAAEALARRKDEVAAGRPNDAVRAERAAALRATRRCATCGSAALVSISAARSGGVVIRCPSCGERALTVQITGIA